MVKLAAKAANPSTSGLVVVSGESLRHPPREARGVHHAARAKADAELPCLPLLLFLVVDLHSRDREIPAIQVSAHCDRVLGSSIRQVFLEA
jgi:hypothetical protein